MGLFLLGFTFAHQPRLVFKQPVGQIVNVEHPEISQAFYGILSGYEDVYQIVSDTGFLLYVNIVVPAFSGQRTDFVVHIHEPKDIATSLEGASSVRTDFFEPFAGDTYLKWPSFEKYVDGGVYTITVSNPGNQGKYSLTIGKIESFPFKEMVQTFKAIPTLKVAFFEKSRYAMFRNYVWLMIMATLIIGIVVIRWIIRLVKYIISDRKTWL